MRLVVLRNDDVVVMEAIFLQVLSCQRVSDFEGFCFKLVKFLVLECEGEEMRSLVEHRNLRPYRKKILGQYLSATSFVLSRWKAVVAMESLRWFPFSEYGDQQLRELLPLSPNNSFLFFIYSSSLRLNSYPLMLDKGRPEKQDYGQASTNHMNSYQNK